MKSNFRFFLYLLLLWFPFSLFFLRSFISQKIRLISQYARCEAKVWTLPLPWQVKASISKVFSKHIEKRLSEVYSRSCQTSETISKIVNGLQPLTIFGKISILDIWEGSKYTSAYLWSTFLFENPALSYWHPLILWFRIKPT